MGEDLGDEIVRDVGEGRTGEPGRGSDGSIPVDVPELPFAATYWTNGWPGATRRLLVHPEVRRRLAAAESLLAALGTSYELGLLVFDGFRPEAVQRSIFDDYVSRLERELGVSKGRARALATEFVSNPDSTYPHGTGGTVDLTMTIDGSPAWMGTVFDDFSERSRRDWFSENPPESELELLADRNRQWLFSAMGDAGFVGISTEWWHFEWGTARWAEQVRCEPVLTKVWNSVPGGP